MAEARNDGGVTKFYIIWFSQILSLFGSNMTTFGLGVWVVQQTGSATEYGLTVLFSLVPVSLTAPIAGSIIDRVDRRLVMVISDSLSGLNTLVVLLLLTTGNLQLWNIYFAAVANAVFSTFQGPAYQASISLLLPKSMYGRAAGLLQLGEALALLVASPIAGLLLAIIALPGIMILDLTTLTFSLVILYFIRLPRPNSFNGNGAAHNEPRRSVISDFIFGLRYILRWPGFLGMTLYVAVFLQILFGFAQILIFPMVLSFTSEEVFGFVVGAIGIGALVGGILMAAWGGPKRRARGIFIFSIPYGLAMILGGLAPDPRLVALAGFILAIAHAMITGCNRAIWQVKIAPEVQGRVFTLRLLIAVGAQAVGVALAGPLADRVFEPLMAVQIRLNNPTLLSPILIQQGPLADSVGSIIGAGAGRGYALMFIALGVLVLIFNVIALLNPRVRRLDIEIPDAVPDDDPLSAPAVT